MPRPICRSLIATIFFRESEDEKKIFSFSLYKCEAINQENYTKIYKSLIMLKKEI